MSLLRRLPPDKHAGSELAALNRGREALALRRFAEASAWLDRARRLAPGNAAIKLLYASSLIAVDDDRAKSQLDEIISLHPTAWPAMRLRAVQAYRLGEVDRAADLVSTILSHSAVPPDEPFLRFSTELAETAGKPGWSGLSDAGILVCSAPGALSLDGRNLTVRPTGDGRLFRARLPASWRRAQRLDVTQGGCHLLGSPIDVGALNSVQGFVGFNANASEDRIRLSGWAWMPGCPDVQPTIRVLSGDRQAVLLSAVANDEAFKPLSSNGVARPRGFAVDVACAREEVTLHVVDFLGRDLFGSPLNIAAQRAIGGKAAPRARSPSAAPTPPVSPQSAAAPARGKDSRPGATAGASRSGKSPPVDIIIPVFNGAEDLRACLASVRRSPAADTRLVIVDDASTDHALQNALQDAAGTGAIILRQPRNLGFPSAANAGLRHTVASPGSRDVVLLNPDTLVAAGWLDRLRSAAYASDDTGSVTPMTNDGSMVSYPSPGHAHPPADQAETDDLARLFSETNPGVAVEIPTAVGFCMYIRRDCLVRTGLFREDVFAQGYAEENDWSLRARKLGWRHVADGSTFVSHAGGRSFGLARRDLLARNLKTLNHLHPGYDRAVRDFLVADPLRVIRKAADIARWRRETARSGSVILVTHIYGGGVERHVRARAQAIRRQGLRPVVLRPPVAVIGSDRFSDVCHVAEEDPGRYANLLFRWKTDLAGLLQLLRQERPRWVEIHHPDGHDPQILKIPELLGVPYDFVVHDFASVCPRVSMCGKPGVHCGEPADVQVCESCVEKHGNRLAEAIGPAVLRERTNELVAGARRVVAPTHDTARRFSQYANAARLDIQPWEDDSALSAKSGRVGVRREGEDVRVCVVGAIGEEKGFAVLLACARDAARRKLALTFRVVGHTVDDAKLIDTDRAFITGRYEEDECQGLIAAQHADVGLLPSTWPETWCYALSALWGAGLWPVLFDLGGHAERVRQTSKGTLLPPGLSPRGINDALLSLVHGRKQAVLF